MPSFAQHLRSAVFTRRRLAIIILLLAGCAVFLSVYDGMKETSDLGHLDIPVMTWAATHQYPPLASLMRIITNLLSPVAISAVTFGGAALWAWRKKEYWQPAVITGAVSFGFIIAGIIKTATARARPNVSDLVSSHASISYSFPSGHTIGVAVLLLTLGYFMYMRRETSRRLLSWLLICATGIILVAFSRIYLGYHWLTDVTASVGLAVIILALVIIVDSYKRRRDRIIITK